MSSSKERPTALKPCQAQQSPFVIYRTREQAIREFHEERILVRKLKLEEEAKKSKVEVEKKDEK